MSIPLLPSTIHCGCHSDVDVIAASVVVSVIRLNHIFKLKNIYLRRYVHMYIQEEHHGFSMRLVRPPFGQKQIKKSEEGKHGWTFMDVPSLIYSNYGK